MKIMNIYFLYITMLTIDIASIVRNDKYLKLHYMNRLYGKISYKSIFNHSERTAVVAINKGHYELLKWLDTYKPRSYTKNEITYAIMNGHFNITKWLHQFQCYRGDAVEFAAVYGHTHIVLWLINNGYQYKYYTIYMCLLNKRVNIAKILLLHSDVKYFEPAYLIAVDYKFYDIAKILESKLV